MLDVFLIIFTIYILGIISFIIFFKPLYILKDKGWFISKIVGLVVLSTFVWIITLLTPIPNLSYVWRSTFVLLFIISVLVLIFSDNRKDIKSFFMENKFQILLFEFIFILIFSIFLLLRVYDNNAIGTEKPMDSMMLNAVFNSYNTPPVDLWMSGNTISYYYFGYWIFGGFYSILFSETSNLYNISFSLIPALSAISALSFVFNFISYKRKDKSRYIKPLFISIITPVFLIFSSNLYGLLLIIERIPFVPLSLLNWINGEKHISIVNYQYFIPSDFWWWWKSSRVINSFNNNESIDFTINEFPYFSFLLGDFHPHMISIPFFITSIILFFGYFVLSKYIFHPDKRPKISIYFSLLLILFLGSTGFINMWNLAFLVLLTLIVVFFTLVTNNFTFKKFFKSKFILELFLLWFLGVIIFFNFYFITSDSQIKYPFIAFNDVTTRPIHFIYIWILPCIFTIPVIYYLYKENISSNSISLLIKNRLNLFIIFIFMSSTFFWAFVNFFSSDQSIGQIILSLMIFYLFFFPIIFIIYNSILVNIYKKNILNLTYMLLILASFILLFSSEIFYIRDIFDNRMNTIFKFHYQIWIIFSILFGISLKILINYKPKKVTISFLSVLFIILAFSNLYFVSSSFITKINESGTITPNLSSIEHLENNKNKIDLIRYLKQYYNHDDVLIESYGQSYSNNNIIPSESRIPTVLGWIGHELQWRSNQEEVLDREKDINTFYETDDINQINNIINKYSITIIILGPNEIEKYNLYNLQNFLRISEIIYENDEFKLLEVF